jgi:hypothetical protein
MKVGESMLNQPFIPKARIERFDVVVLVWFFRLDQKQSNAT